MFICTQPPSLPLQMELAQSVNQAWVDRTAVDVLFVEGDPQVWDRVALVVQSQWNSICGFHFRFTQDPDSEIRVGFAPGGSWSYIGQDALRIAPPDVTMNFGWLCRDTPQAEVIRVVTHEFGHALGFVHEHQSPKASIPWDRLAVYAHYRTTNGWGVDEVNKQVLDRLSPLDVNQSAYDPRSIMHYTLDRKLLQDKSFVSGAIPLTGCSPEDVRMAQVWYGKPFGDGGHKTYLPSVWS